MATGKSADGGLFCGHDVIGYGCFYRIQGLRAEIPQENADGCVEFSSEFKLPKHAIYSVWDFIGFFNKKNPVAGIYFEGGT